MKPLVSVIIPTHNRCALLGKTLHSVYSQNGVQELCDLEVIVIDDASSDSTADSVSQYPAARYFRLPTSKGAAVARNTGLRMSRGLYIAFLDDDDVWHPDKLSLQIPILQANPDAPIVYGRVLLNQKGQQSVFPDARGGPSGRVFTRLLMGNFCGNPAGFLFGRQALEAVAGFDESLRYGEDYDLWLRLAARFPFTFVPAIVASIRLSPVGHYATGIADGSRVRTMRRIIENALALLPDDENAQAMRQRARLACGVGLIADYPIYRAEWIHLLVTTTLREFPEIIHSPTGRDAVAQRVREFALVSPTPLTAAQSFCDDLVAAVAGNCFRHRLGVRRMLGRAWAEVAAGLLVASWPTRGAAAIALARSVSRDPSAVPQRVSRAWWRAARKFNGARSRGKTTPDSKT
jgi:glycosyltransferase involved in cell wall biosynthesis